MRRGAMRAELEARPPRGCRRDVAAVIAMVAVSEGAGRYSLAVNGVHWAWGPAVRGRHRSR